LPAGHFSNPMSGGGLAPSATSRFWMATTLSSW
jgi:hypothetical protein